jgi:hypothetical protein
VPANPPKPYRIFEAAHAPGRPPPHTRHKDDKRKPAVVFVFHRPNPALLSGPAPCCTYVLNNIQTPSRIRARRRRRARQARNGRGGARARTRRPQRREIACFFSPSILRAYQGEARPPRLMARSLGGRCGDVTRRAAVARAVFLHGSFVGRGRTSSTRATAVGGRWWARRWVRLVHSLAFG